MQDVAVAALSKETRRSEAYAGIRPRQTLGMERGGESGEILSLEHSKTSC